MENGASRTPRTDIQGLRAIAVAMVVVYHLRSSLLPGGFVGVDVFFVISGFLITAHLIGRPPTRLQGLFAFWGRRIRRLLPASLLVLAVTLVLVRLVAPPPQWEANAAAARAAALYVVNWALASSAVDYLASDAMPTAVQHFWSLSLEEQFYFGWPIMIGLTVLVAARARWRTQVALAVTLSAVVVASFVFSIIETSANPAAAYFITPTRIWELGLGGLAALLTASRPDPLRSAALRAAAAWTGIAMIAATGVLYSGSTAFPGYQAALPVVGTALVIVARPEAGLPRSPGRLLATRPAQWLGDVSYSVYLWHWPLIVLAPSVLHHEPGLLALAAIAALTLVLAAVTERYVERPFRNASLSRFQGRTYVTAVAGMATVVVMATVLVAEVDRDVDRDRVALAQALADGGPCFGAAALDPGQHCDPVAADELVPAPALAAKDKSAAYKDIGGRQCWSFTPHFPDRRCTFGRRDSDVTVALVGNSHAGQWLPALQRVARANGWRIQTYLASQCAFSAVAQVFATDAHSQACLSWVRRTAAAVAHDRPDLVVTANRVSVRAVGSPSFDASLPRYADGYRTVFGTLRRAGLPVLVLRDTPASGEATPTCVAEHTDDYSACDGSRSDWLPPDPAVEVVRSARDPQLRLVDLTDHICDGDACRSVTGGVITYFDASHLTATFAYTLAPYLAPSLKDMLR